MVGDSATQRANYQDVLDAPPNLVAEVLAGELHTQRRPAGRHAYAASVLGMDLGNPFHRGRGGPGGWVILDEPELHLASDILVPDLAGWRRERMPEIPDEAYFELRPDLACEILSPSTALCDRSVKIPIYARERVAHVWLVDPQIRSIEVFRLDGDGYRLVAAHGDAELVRLEPLDAVELELAALWGRAIPVP